MPLQGGYPGRQWPHPAPSGLEIGLAGGLADHFRGRLFLSLLRSLFVLHDFFRFSDFCLLLMGSCVSVFFDLLLGSLFLFLCLLFFLCSQLRIFLRLLCVGLRLNFPKFFLLLFFDDR